MKALPFTQFQGKAKEALRRSVSTVVFLCVFTSICLGVTINGPSQVCPGTTATYTVGCSVITTYQTWEYYNDARTFDPLNKHPDAQGSPNTGSGAFTIVITVSQNPTISSNGEHGLLIVTTGIDPGMRYGDNAAMNITRDIPRPDRVNGGLINVCNAGEQVALSIPALPTGTCGWCNNYQWLSSNSSWNLYSDGQGPSSNIHSSLNTATLYAPNPLPGSGYAATTLEVKARYDLCPAANSIGVFSDTQIFIGTPSVSNGQVNGNSYGGGTYVVPSGYATLNVQIDGGGTTNWYVANGSGSLSPSYNYCTVSFSNFVRVVVDASNRCGLGSSYVFYLSTQQGYYGYRIAPNPAKDNLSLLLDYKEMAGEAIQGVTLYDANNKAWYSADLDKLKKNFVNKNSIDLTTKDFPRGIYFLHVKMGNEVHKHQISLQ